MGEKNQNKIDCKKIYFILLDDFEAVFSICFELDQVSTTSTFYIDN